MTPGTVPEEIRWPDRTCLLRTGALEETFVGPLLGEIPTAQLLLRDSGVPQEVLDPIRKVLGSRAPLHEFSVAGGEAVKSSQGWREILEMLAEARIDRAGLMVVVGGGAVADAAAFAASIWHRGIPWIGVPTTLLAMVDAHVGGKTAVHFEGIKNRIGTFHLPRAVIADPALLTSLPRAQRALGWAELIKAAWIGDAELLETLESDRGSIAQDLIPTVHQIAAAVAVKVRIVVEDPYEEGSRELLNFGHTLAHALEMNSSPAVPHGAAVAIGMVFAARLSHAMGETTESTEQRLREVLQAVELPTDWQQFDLEAINNSLCHDKKARGGEVRWVLPRSPGQMVVRSVPREVVEQVLR